MIDVEHATVAGQVRPGDNIVHNGREAWVRIQKCQTWLDWQAVGEALEFGRKQVEDEIEKEGRGNRDHLFSAWLKDHGFDKIDKATRSHLATCMAHQEEIEKFRQNIGTAKALKLNHPSSILRAWKKSTQPPAPRKPKIGVAEAQAPTDGQAIIALQKKLDAATFDADQLREKLELYQSGEAPNPPTSFDRLMAADAAQNADIAAQKAAGQEPGQPGMPMSDMRLERAVSDAAAACLTEIMFAIGGHRFNGAWQKARKAYDAKMEAEGKVLHLSLGGLGGKPKGGGGRKRRKAASALPKEIDEEPAPVEAPERDDEQPSSFPVAQVRPREDYSNGKVREENRAHAAEHLKAHDKFLKPHERKRLTAIEGSTRDKNELGVDADEKWLRGLEYTVHQRAHEAERKAEKQRQKEKRLARKAARAPAAQTTEEVDLPAWPDPDDPDVQVVHVPSVERFEALGVVPALAQCMMHIPQVRRETDAMLLAALSREEQETLATRADRTIIARVKKLRPAKKKSSARRRRRQNRRGAKPARRRRRTRRKRGCNS